MYSYPMLITPSFELFVGTVGGASRSVGVDVSANVGAAFTHGCEHLATAFAMRGSKRGPPRQYRAVCEPRVES